MVDDKPPSSPDPAEGPVGAGQGYTAIAYLITGILVWGFVGWLVDRWLSTGGVATAIGAVVGAGAGVYLIARRLIT
jgi:ATP synthase protein I